MRPEYIHYLLEIYHHRSISSAAHALHIGQTTLSSIVKASEKELGFPIFLRAPTGVTATEEGERLMQLAWELDVRYEELLSLKSREDNTAQPIHVLLSPCVNAGLALPLSRQFYQFDLRGDLTIEEKASTEIGPYIVQNDANIGVTHLAKPTLDALQRQHADTVKVEILCQDCACLLLPPGHPLAGREEIRPQDLQGERLATVTSFRPVHDPALVEALEGACAQVISFPSISTMEQAVRAGGMVGIITAYAKQAAEIAPACQIVPLGTREKAQSIPICLIYRIDRRPRCQERILCTCIRTYFEEFRSGCGDAIS